MNTIEVHQHFSSHCFNKTWELLELSERTPEQTREMIATAQASLFHWLNREDCTPLNLSIGLWQLARVYALANSPFESMRNAKDCLDISESNKLSAFFVAYAHEAISRAGLIGEDRDIAASHLKLAKKYAAEVTDEHDKKLIDTDLQELSEKIEQ